MGDRSPLAAILLSVFLLLAFLASPPSLTGGVVLSERSVVPSALEAPARVLVTPLSARANALARQLLGVDIRHEFKGSFSADVSPSVLPRLRLYADVVPVGIFDLQSPPAQSPSVLGIEADFGDVVLGPASLDRVRLSPVCGDGRCHGGERTACREDCRRFLVRSCVPSERRGYNILQLGGGKDGDGKGVVVAVLDSGAAVEHLDLKSNIRLCVDTTGAGVQAGCDDENSVSHGTHTAGIIAASGGSDGEGMMGVSPSASLLIVKACRSSVCLADDVAEGIELAAAKGAQIVSMSFGAVVEDRLVKEAIQRHPEMLFVASAGNAGPAPDSILYPAAQPEVVAVAAHDKNGVPLWFSSRGITDGNDLAVSAREIELSAGGVDVEGPSADGCYSRLSGTSFSAPAVAGLAAKVWDLADGAVDGRGDAQSVRRFLVSRARNSAPVGAALAPGRFDPASGYGIPLVS